jgi:hypothetical protein
MRLRAALRVDRPRHLPWAESEIDQPFGGVRITIVTCDEPAARAVSRLDIAGVSHGKAD